MMDLQTKLLQKIDESVARYEQLDKYCAGEQALAFLSPESKRALGDRLSRMVANVPRLAVNSVAERLRVTGFSGVEVWPEWLRNDLDQLAPVAHREALALGSSFVIVWADSLGRPVVSIESARQMAMIVDPGSRRPIAAAKRWETETTTEAVIYEADQITRLRANTTGATTVGYEVIELIDNPLGVVPVVPLNNSDRLLGPGVSEISDLIPLVDAMNKLLADMMVGSEFYARPRRWATGVELVEEPKLDDNGDPVLDEDGEPVIDAVNPYPENDRMMIAEESEAKFGALPSSDLASYEAGIRVLLGQIMAVSGLPGHYLGIFSDNPTSADAMRAAEAALTARAESKQVAFGRSWEQVARLMIAVRDGVAVEDSTPAVQWADAATRSVAQEADAVVKLFTSGLLPATYALAKLGYSDTEIVEIRAARRVEALDKAGTDITALAP